MPALSLFSYLTYLDVCARVLRATLKDEFRASAIKRAETGLKAAVWKEGKQGEYSIIHL